MVKKILFATACVALAISSVYSQSKEIVGAGATFPYPLYSKMFDVYYKQFGLKINYQSIGSGGGIKQLQSKTVDFGATDAFMTDEEMKSINPIVHIPICLGSVVVTYNLSGYKDIKLTPQILSDIFLMKITKWNDPSIAKVNADLSLPNRNIIVVHRSDGSGTTSIFTDYLAKVSTEWKAKVGAGKSVNWPGGLGAKGNEGVSGMVKQIPGSIGYCELAYTLQNNMPQVAIQNKSGKFIKATLESTSKAADAEIPADTRVSLTNTNALDGYPISGFTWIVVYKEQSYSKRTIDQSKSLVKLISWMITDGQQYAKPLHYAPLPVSVVKRAENLLKTITYEGKAIPK